MMINDHRHSHSALAGAKGPSKGELISGRTDERRHWLQGYFSSPITSHFSLLWLTLQSDRRSGNPHVPFLALRPLRLAKQGHKAKADERRVDDESTIQHYMMIDDDMTG